MKTEQVDLDKTANSEFSSWIYKYYNKHYRLGFIAYLVIFSSYSLIDYIYYPNLLVYIIFYRVITGVFILSIPVILSYTFIYKKYFLIINAICSSLIPISLSFLLLLFEKEDNQFISIYYAGMTLQMILIGLFVYRWVVSFLSSFLVVVFFLLIKFLFYSNEFVLSNEFQNISFLILISFITGLISYYYQEIKKRMFIAEKELMVEKQIIENNKKIIENHNLELKNLNQSKDKLFSIISHDLKSPFNGFLGLTKLMADNISEFNQEDLTEISKNMQVSARNLLSLLENLFEWANLQQGVTAFNPEPCRLSFIIKQNADILKELANQKDLKLITNISEDCIAMADVQMLNTVIRNLLSNAIKFTPRGGIIEVGLKPSTSGNQLSPEDYCEVYVEDSGIGINRDSLEKIFVINQEISRQGTEGEPSTGLGLLLCKEFIEKQGGKISVKSVEGKGSTFYFTLKKGN